MENQNKHVIGRRKFLNLSGMSVAAASVPLLVSARANTNLADLHAPGDDYRTLRNLEAYSENGKVFLSAFKTMRYYDEKSSMHFKVIKVFRMLCPDFTFGVDYEEYFSSLDYKDAELIFEGTLEPKLRSKFTYTDETAKIGNVYAYWMSSNDGKPAECAPVKVRDPEVWWSYEKLNTKLKELSAKYPHLLQLSSAGYTANRKPMLAIKAGTGKKCILLVGAVHAGEAGPELIAGLLERLLERDQELFKKVSLIAIPSPNCDVRDVLAKGAPWYIRRNANKVDLNRNFPADWDNVDETYGYSTSDPDGFTYRGAYPGSESETESIMKFAKQYKPLAAFSFHWLASIAGESLLASKYGSADKEFTSKCDEVARIFWKGIDPDLVQKQKLRYLCASGSFPHWCYKVLGIPGFDVEDTYDPEDKALCVKDKTDVKLLLKYQEIQYRGFQALLKHFQ